LLLGVVRRAQASGSVGPVAAVHGAALGCCAARYGCERLAAVLLPVVGQAKAFGVALFQTQYRPPSMNGP
jgi:hypothetical protein